MYSNPIVNLIGTLSEVGAKIAYELIDDEEYKEVIKKSLKVKHILDGIDYDAVEKMILNE